MHHQDPRHLGLGKQTFFFLKSEDMRLEHNEMFNSNDEESHRISGVYFRSGLSTP